MVDRITKALRKLSRKERVAFEGILLKIKAGDIANLDVKKLKGNVPVYRIRKGSMRVIYLVTKTGKISILAIERRSDTTYKKF